jgi:uncharacterized membrane protein
MNLQAFLDASPVIQVHALAAIAALLLGAVQLFGPKGTLPHRWLGLVWAGLMALAAITAIFIREVNAGGFSFIHLFIPLTLFGLVGLARSVRPGARKGSHRRLVLTLYLAALVLPGLFTLVPGRLMHSVLFGA